MELGAKGAPVRIELLPIEPLHRLRMLEGSYEEVRAELAGTVQQNADGRVPSLQDADGGVPSLQDADSGAPSPQGEYLSVTLTDRRVTPELAEALRSLCETRGILLMELSSAFREDRREGTLSSAALRERGLAELFAEFYASRSGGAEPDGAELALLQSAAALAEKADFRSEPEPDQIDRLLSEAMRQIES